MKLEIGFGTEPQTVEIPDENIVGVLYPNEVEAVMDAEAVLGTFKNPIESARLREIVKPGEKVAIITSDIMRSTPSYKIIPAILGELEAAGARLDDITEE